MAPLTKRPRLTPAEKTALTAFRAAKRKAGMAPDLIEVAAELNRTKQNAKYLLDRLVKKGRMVQVRRYRGYREVTA